MNAVLASVITLIWAGIVLATGLLVVGVVIGLGERILRAMSSESWPVLHAGNGKNYPPSTIASRGYFNAKNFFPYPCWAGSGAPFPNPGIVPAL